MCFVKVKLSVLIYLYRKQWEDAARRKEEAQMEEDRQRRREEAQRRKEADRNKDEYEVRSIMRLLAPFAMSSVFLFLSAPD